MTLRRHLLALALPLSLLLGVGLLGAGASATAAPKRPEPTFGSVIPYDLAIRGADGSSSVLAPLPEGSRPVALIGTIASTYDAPGSVLVSIGERRGAQVEARVGGDVEIPLTEADIEDQAIPIGLSVRLKANTNCFAGDQGTAVLTDARLVYRYPDATPRTVAGFLSPGARSYTIQTSADPSDAERTAALAAVAALTHRFPAPTRIGVRTGGTPEGSFLDRVVQLVDAAPPNGASNQIAVGRDGVMAVTGQGQALTDATVALGSPATDALSTAQARNLTATPEPGIVDTTVSWEELDLPAVDITGVGRLEQDVVITQAMFGTGLSALKVRVRGGATATPEHGLGRVDLLWNGNLVSSLDLAAAGVVDRTIDVEAADLERVNTLTVRLSYVPPGRDCQPPPIGAQLTIDPATSTVTPQAGQSEPPGFARFPQVLSSSLPVGFGNGTPTALLQQSASLVSALQSQTPHQLVPTVMAESEFLDDGRPGVLVGASDDLTRTLDAPLQTTGDTWQGMAPDGFSVTAAPSASLQAFSAGGRDIVMLGAPGDEAAATQLAAYAASAPDPWLKLPGQVVVLPADAEPTALDFTQPPEQPSLTAPTIVTIVVISLLILLLGWWLWKRPSGPAPPAPGQG